MEIQITNDDYSYNREGYTTIVIKDESLNTGSKYRGRTTGFMRVGIRLFYIQLRLTEIDKKDEHMVNILDTWEKLYVVV